MRPKVDYQLRKRTNKAGEERISVVVEVWVNGERKVVSGGTHDHEREAIRSGERLLMQFEGNGEKLKALHGTVLLREWIEEWLQGLTVEEATLASYRWRMERWVIPHLDVPLKNLTPQSIDRWVNGPALARLSKSSKRSALDVLRGALRKAVKVGMLPHNPAEDVSVDSTKKQMKADRAANQIKTWTYDEVGKLLDSAVDQPVEPIVVLGLLAGLRPGEATLVRWADIDFALGTVRVSRTITRGENLKRTISNSTKNGDTRTTILTSDAAFRLLKIKERLEAEGPVDPDTPIYVHHAGGAPTAGRQLKRLCEEAGVKVLWPHCLRHTHASMLLENGATLAAVAKQLGHSNPTVTAKVYWHLMSTDNDTISGVMDLALKKPVPTEPDPSDASRATTVVKDVPQ